MKYLLQIGCLLLIAMLSACSNIVYPPAYQSEINKTYLLDTDYYLVQTNHFGSSTLHAVNTQNDCCLPIRVTLPRIEKYYRNPGLWKTWRSSFLMTHYRIVGLLMKYTRYRVINVGVKNGTVIRYIGIETGPFRGKKVLIVFK